MLAGLNAKQSSSFGGFAAFLEGVSQFRKAIPPAEFNRTKINQALRHAF
jgi:hypothetical protein